MVDWQASHMSRQEKRPASPAQDEIDRIVISKAGNDLAWERAVHVKRSRAVSLSLPGELAKRAEFLAKLHREANLAKWVERIVRDKVELEELAFTDAKRKLAS